MKKTILGLSMSLVLFIFTSSVQALPRFALQKGLKCISCHINPTGGAARNSYGTMMFGRNELPVPAHGPTADFNSNLTEQLVLGADIRTQFLYDGNQKKTGFQAMQMGIYLCAYLNPRMTLFTKMDMKNKEFEAYALFSFWSQKFILKAGSFLPAYGIRVDDHTSYTRGGNLGIFKGFPTSQSQGLIFYPNYREVGVEGTFYVGKSITANLAITNGFSSGFNNKTVDFSNNKAIIGRVEYFSKFNSVNYFIGGSFYSGQDSLKMIGGFVGINWERTTLLIEFDQAKKLPGVSRTDVRLVEFNYLIIQGIYSTIKFDLFDPDDSKPYIRYTIGVEYFPMSYVEIRPQFRMNNAPDPADPNKTTTFNEGVIQLHIWF